jgi:hypothetical protein
MLTKSAESAAQEHANANLALRKDLDNSVAGFKQSQEANQALLKQIKELSHALDQPNDFNGIVSDFTLLLRLSTKELLAQASAKAAPHVTMVAVWWDQVLLNVQQCLLNMYGLIVTEIIPDLQLKLASVNLWIRRTFHEALLSIQFLIEEKILPSYRAHLEPIMTASILPLYDLYFRKHVDSVTHVAFGMLQWGETKFHTFKSDVQAWSERERPKLAAELASSRARAIVGSTQARIALIKLYTITSHSLEPYVGSSAGRIIDWILVALATFFTLHFGIPFTVATMRVLSKLILRLAQVGIYVTIIFPLSVLLYPASCFRHNRGS